MSEQIVNVITTVPYVTNIFDAGVQPYPFVYYSDKTHDGHEGLHRYISEPRGPNVSLIKKDFLRAKDGFVIQEIFEKEFYRVKYPWGDVDYSKKDFENRWIKEPVPKTISFLYSDCYYMDANWGWARMIVTREYERDENESVRWATTCTVQSPIYGEYSRTQRDNDPRYVSVRQSSPLIFD